LSFSPNNHLSQNEARQEMMDCAKDVKTFLTANKMKQNDDKTEFLIIGTPGQKSKVLFQDIDICNANVTSSNKARNLGVLFDSEMKLKTHVNNMCKSGFFHIRNLSAIRNILDRDSAKMATHAFITSTLDYGNSLLCGLPKTRLNKLQILQNAAARVVINAKRSDQLSMTAVRRDLHWLPVEARIKFKTLSMAWKAYNGAGPEYINELLIKKHSLCDLRSNNAHLFEVPATKLVTYGDRAFQKAAPVMWNELPIELRRIQTFNTFKNKLKTHLFSKYYNTS
jgi:hypothetical protein